VFRPETIHYSAETEGPRCIHLVLVRIIIDTCARYLQEPSCSLIPKWIGTSNIKLLKKDKKYTEHTLLLLSLIAQCSCEYQRCSGSEIFNWQVTFWTNCVIDRLISNLLAFYCLVGLIFHWLTDWHVDWLTAWLIVPLVSQSLRLPLILHQFYGKNMRFRGIVWEHNYLLSPFKYVVKTNTIRKNNAVCQQLYPQFDCRCWRF
jgi:hypothetical protein